jgi:hypothetical protein
MKKELNWQQKFIKKHQFIYIMCIAIPLILFYIILKNNINNKKNDETSIIKKQETFTATVIFTGTQFIISNLDINDCENSQMRLNSDYKLDGYTIKSTINSIDEKTNKTLVYTVGASQFVKNNGTRFNPYITKPLNFYIGCQGNNELNGIYWYGKF